MHFWSVVVALGQFPGNVSVSATFLHYHLNLASLLCEHIYREEGKGSEEIII